MSVTQLHCHKAKLNLWGIIHLTLFVSACVNLQTDGAQDLLPPGNSHRTTGTTAAAVESHDARPLQRHNRGSTESFHFFVLLFLAFLHLSEQTPPFPLGMLRSYVANIAT